MSSVSHPSAQPTPERSWFELLHVREMWASLAIAAMWIAVACSAAWGPDFVSTTGGGTNSYDHSIGNCGSAVRLGRNLGCREVRPRSSAEERRSMGVDVARHERSTVGRR